MIGDRRKYLTALFTLDPESWSAAAAQAGSVAQTPADAARCPAFAKWFAARLEEANRRLARVQTIKRWTLLPEPFSIQTGELTPTMKVKRAVVQQRHIEVIEQMHDGENAL